MSVTWGLEMTAQGPLFSSHPRGWCYLIPSQGSLGSSSVRSQTMSDMLEDTLECLHVLPTKSSLLFQIHPGVVKYLRGPLRAEEIERFLWRRYIYGSVFWDAGWNCLLLVSWALREEPDQFPREHVPSEQMAVSTASQKTKACQAGEMNSVWE